jgi:PHD/YefM family antitoxin component YafN of YafNO toxin-antitoxin module
MGSPAFLRSIFNADYSIALPPHFATIFKITEKGTYMNAIAANELKRHGISAVEQLLTNGPVHIIKRNQPICVMLTEDEYEKLTKAAQATASVNAHTVMDWFLLPAAGTATKEEIDQRLNAERDAWDTP